MRLGTSRSRKWLAAWGRGSDLVSRRYVNRSSSTPPSSRQSTLYWAQPQSRSTPFFSTSFDSRRLKATRAPAAPTLDLAHVRGRRRPHASRTAQMLRAHASYCTGISSRRNRRASRRLQTCCRGAVRARSAAWARRLAGRARAGSAWRSRSRRFHAAIVRCSASRFALIVGRSGLRREHQPQRIDEFTGLLPATPMLKTPATSGTRRLPSLFSRP